jgi:phage-related protein (TIGR01555 family)
MGKLKGVVDVIRSDGWYNALTGLGNALRDKITATQFLRSAILSDDHVENLYHEEDVAARIVEALPEEGLRKPYQVSIEGEEESEIPGEVSAYDKRLSFRKELRECAVWARCYGGAVVYLGIEDGQEESEPVNLEAVQTIKFATVITKRDIRPETYYDDPEEDDFGKPKTYVINQLPTGGPTTERMTNIEIHESRLIRLDGARTSPHRKQNNNGWNESVLQKVHTVLVQFNVGWQGVAHLLQDAAQGVFKLKGLVDMVAGGDKDTLNARMEVVEMGRSVARAIMLDAEEEEFERLEYSFSGVPEVLRSFMMRMAAAARMPVTVLMGQSPAGLNVGTGENDVRMWYDRVEQYQTEELQPAIEYFVRLVFAAQDFPAAEPPKWEILFASLWQMDDEQKAKIEKLVAERDKLYIESGVLLPEEVALNRFKASGFNTETQIDMDAREEMLKAEIKLAKEKAGEDPLDGIDPSAAGAPQPGAQSDPQET